MENEREYASNPGTLTATMSNEPLFPGEFNSQPIMATLEKAADSKEVDNEIDELESDFPGITERLFKTHKDSERHERATAYRIKMANILKAVATNPTPWSPGVQAMQQVLTASLIGPVIDYMPSYQPFHRIVLQRTASKDFQMVRSGQDTLQYETPIAKGEAYAFDPVGPGGSKVIEISGSNSTVYPYFISTPRKVLNFWQWAQRLIKVPVLMKKHVTEELDSCIDGDLITHFDAVIPNATLYSSHATHIVTVADAVGGVTIEKFKQAARLLRHTDSSTGTKHIAAPGYALADPKAIDDIEDWGDEAWTEEEVSKQIKETFGQPYDETLFVGKRVQRFVLLQTPLDHCSDNRQVRLFAQPRQVGYFIPITVNGKNKFMKVGPMSGNDPDWNETQRVTEPPGFSFFVQGWMGLAMIIANPFALSKLYHA